MVTVIVPLLCPRPLPRVRFFSPWFRSKMRSGSPQIGHANATARGGTLEYGGLFSMQVEGAQKHRTGLHIDISGTEGVLRITNSLAFQNKDDNAIEGMNGDAQTFSPLPIPDQYRSLALVWS